MYSTLATGEWRSYSAIGSDSYTENSTQDGPLRVVGQTPLVSDLFESEYRYFEAGAVSDAIPGGFIVRMPGLEVLAAGCVVQRLAVELIESAADDWLLSVEKRLLELSVRRARLYLSSKAPHLREALVRHGYRAVKEVPLLTLVGAEPFHNETVPGLELRPLISDRDWLKKQTVYQRMERGPDGHVSPPHLWIELERRKSESNYMKPYLVTLQGKVCGAVSAAAVGSVMRLKNLVISPDYRRRGVGRAVAAAFTKIAAENARSAAGCFAIEGSASLPMYQQAGYQSVGFQTEWTKYLDDPVAGCL